MSAARQSAPRPRPGLASLLLIAALLGLGLARRIVATSEYRNFAGDGWQYFHLAENLVGEHRYAFGPRPQPLAWSRLPGYPLYLSTVGKVGRGFAAEDVGQRAARGQVVLDVLTMLLAFLVAAELGFALPRYLALALCALSPLLALCTTYILSETAAIFLSTLALWLLLRACRERLALHLALAGAALGLGLLVRADAITLAPAFAVPLLVARTSLADKARAAVLAAIACAVVFAPWPIRNVMRFGAPHALGSSWVSKQGDPLPTGVQEWLRTWAVDPQQAADVAWKMTKGNPVYPLLLPPEAFDSDAERKRVAALFEGYNRDGLIGPEVDAGFEAVAKERRAHDRSRYFLKLPLRRARELWWVAVPDWELPIQSPSLGLPFARERLVPLTHRTLLLTIIGLIFALALPRARPLALLFLVAAVSRTAALAFIVPGGTQRYTFELLPLALVLAAFALTVPAELAWRRLVAARAPHSANAPAP